LNQPLTAILCNAQAAQHLLAEDNMDVSEVREILTDIVNDDKRTGEVIGRLRTMLRRAEAQIHQLDVTQLRRFTSPFLYRS
jgi:two-component system sensor kinase FixL